MERAFYSKDKDMSAQKPRPGAAWHPMTGFPRNAACPCGSGKKFKKCCVDKFAGATVKAEKREEVAAFVKASRELHEAGQLKQTINEARA